MKTYYGERWRGLSAVRVRERRLGRDRVYALRDRGFRTRHAEGYDWGRVTAGSVELARQLLADCLGPEYLERPDVYEAFMREIVAGLPGRRWRLGEGAVRAWAELRGIPALAEADEDVFGEVDGRDVAALKRPAVRVEADEDVFGERLVAAWDEAPPGAVCSA